MSRLKKAIGVSFIAVMLFGCMFAGRHGLRIKGPHIKKWGDYDIKIQGSSMTDENPWGFTAGVITDDQVGDCVLLTPDTSFLLKVPSNSSNVNIQARIHPLMREVSDGAGIDVTVFDSKGSVLRQDSRQIEGNGTWISILYNLADIPDAAKVVFSCNAGGTDYSGDWVVFRKKEIYPSNFGKEHYVRSATYFGEEWPMNFWNCELKTLDVDFKQILADGFDSIVLVIPWKEFQPGISPIEYNRYPFDNLNKVMKSAQENGLDVYVRVGYVWDFFNDAGENVHDRFQNLIRDDKTRQAWLDYCKKLYENLEVYPNFKGGFLTWEDLWFFLDYCNSEDEAVRLESAKEIGYQAWVESEIGLDEYNKKYGCAYKSYEEIPVPRRNELAMLAYFGFYDYCQNGLLSDTQKVFPNMSIEVRLDADAVVTEDGNLHICTHEGTYKCENSDYTATMYGIPMGFENHGERVSAEEAMEKTDYTLFNLTEKNDGKPVYIEQFLYKDNSQFYPNNAQVRDEEVGKYLESVSDILYNYTRGYAVWAYRDYRTNLLYNSQFALGDAGWTISGNPVIGNSEQYGTFSCRLAAGDEILQAIPPTRCHYRQDEYKLIFDVLQSTAASLEIQFGNAVNTVEITGPGRYETKFPANDSFDLRLKAISGEAEIDNLCLYTFTQEGQIYDADNNEMEYTNSIRTLNKKLSEQN